MASTQESGKPTPESQVSDNPHRNFNYIPADISLRVLLFATTLTAVIVMVTSKQTELVPVRSPSSPGGFQLVPRPAKFNHSPAFIYFVAALSLACLHSIVSILITLFLSRKPYRINLIMFHKIIFDGVMLGIVASATGTAGGVAYIGLKGNSHVGWTKVCSTYDKFCRHVGSSVALSLASSIILVLLAVLSAYSLLRRSS